MALKQSALNRNRISGQAEAENDELSNALEKLRQELKNANQHVDRALKTAQDDFNMRKIQLHSALLLWEESEIIKGLNRKLGCLHIDLHFAQTESRRQVEAQKYLEESYEEVEGKLQRVRQNASP